MDKEILEGNKLIVQFMGGIVMTNNTCDNYTKICLPDWAYRLYDFDTLRINSYEYNSSWDWLMPVVENIDSVLFGDTLIEGKWCQINTPSSLPIRHRGISKIEAVWLSVIEFIKWYNRQSKITNA